MLRTIHLHGHLAEQFGEHPIEVDIVTPVEAVRALSVLKAGFRSALRQGSYHLLVKHGDRYFDIGEEELALQLGRSTEVHIVPALEGSKNNGAVLKIVLGVALVAGAFLMAPAMVGAAGGIGATAIGFGGVGITYGQIAMIGLGLAITGVSQLLAPQAKTPEEEKDTSSFIISPSENTVQQGASVPIVIGRYMVGSVVMSVGILTEQLLSGSNYGEAPIVIDENL